MLSFFGVARNHAGQHNGKLSSPDRVKLLHVFFLSEAPFFLLSFYANIYPIQKVFRSTC